MPKQQQKRVVLTQPHTVDAYKYIYTHNCQVGITKNMHMSLCTYICLYIHIPTYADYSTIWRTKQLQNICPARHNVQKRIHTPTQHLAHCSYCCYCDRCRCGAATLKCSPTRLAASLSCVRVLYICISVCMSICIYLCVCAMQIRVYGIADTNFVAAKVSTFEWHIIYMISATVATLYTCTYMCVYVVVACKRQQFCFKPFIRMLE